ncbi:MAG TPA: MFS transporter [Tepidisphaeraceae bacterium]|jgi:PPP family 3-phenylpropionic acid transporter|nr:MFS transporter [Tepidisphaeraceae bacterium]
MRDTRLQFFLTLAMLGTVLPYVSVFFRDAGLSDRLVGTAFAIYGLASVLSPMLVTAVADRTNRPRRLLTLLNLFAGIILVLLSRGHGVGEVMTLWVCYCLVSVPIFPLLNGIFFAQQERRREAGLVEMPYHAARAWGTVGYVVVSLLLFPALHYGMSLGGVLMAGGIVAGCAAVQALLLADPRSPTAHVAEKLPAFAAAKILLGRRHFAFTAAVICMCMASQIHSAFYPVYLTERIKLANQWLGQASNVAVAVEAVIIFSCGFLLRRIGIKRLLMFGIAATALRMGLLASTHHVFIAIGTQVFHGLLILVIGVIPQALFNDHAGERFRHSVQGMLVMLTSAGQCLASFSAGFVAAYSLSAVFASAMGLCLISAILVFYGFQEQPGAPIDGQGELAADTPARTVTPDRVTVVP